MLRIRISASGRWGGCARVHNAPGAGGKIGLDERGA